MKKISTFCMAASLAVGSALAVASMVSNTAKVNGVELTEVRPNTPFVVITSVDANMGKAKIGLDNYTINVAFDYETGVITDQVSGEQYQEMEITSIYDVVVRDLNGKQVYDFTDYQDHQEFASMIRHKLMEY